MSLVLTAPNGPLVTLVLGGGSEMHISTPSPSILMFMVVSVPILANEQRWFINLKPCLQIFQALLGLMISRIRRAAIAVLWTPCGARAYEDWKEVYLRSKRFATVS
jgi:hypothetical protein